MNSFLFWSLNEHLREFSHVLLFVPRAAFFAAPSFFSGLVSANAQASFELQGVWFEKFVSRPESYVLDKTAALVALFYVSLARAWPFLPCSPFAFVFMYVLVCVSVFRADRRSRQSAREVSERGDGRCHLRRPVSGTSRLPSRHDAAHVAVAD